MDSAVNSTSLTKRYEVIAGAPRHEAVAFVRSGYPESR